MVGIVIPTINRSEFLIRQLYYYANQGYRYGIYIGDSSGDDHSERAQEVVQRLKGRLNLVYNRYPDLNDMQTTSQLLHLVREPFAAWTADDDFLVPSSLERCAQFLDSHPDYSSACGVAALSSVGDIDGQRQLLGVGRYRRRSVEYGSARERLVDHLANYFVAFFSVHRTEDFRGMFNAATPIPDTSFRELLTSCLSIVRGKSKELDSFYLVRQDHGRRYLLPDSYDWVTSSAWFLSYQIFRDCLAEELVRQDGLKTEEAREVVKQAFWAYLGKGLATKWEQRYGKNLCGSRYVCSLWRRLASRIPGARQAHRIFRSVTGTTDPLSLSSLSHPSSPYYREFTSVCRAMIGPLEEVVKGGLQ